MRHGRPHAVQTLIHRAVYFKSWLRSEVPYGIAYELQLFKSVRLFAIIFNTVDVVYRVRPAGVRYSPCYSHERRAARGTPSKDFWSPSHSSV
jgi:hypothetical protein